MAGLAVYDIAPIEDRADELIGLIGGPSADEWKALVKAGNVGAFVRKVLDNLQLPASDDGACAALHWRQGVGTHRAARPLFRASATALTASLALPSHLCHTPRSPHPAEIDGLFMLLFSFLKELPAADVAHAVGVVSAALVGGGAAPAAKGAAARMRALVNLYNTLADATHKGEKLALLRSIIRFAADTRQTELLASLFSTAGSWTSKWGLTDQQARELFLLSSSALEKAGDAEGAQGFLIRYLGTFENDAGAINDDALGHAKNAALGYVKAPALSQRSALPKLVAVSVVCLREGLGGAGARPSATPLRHGGWGRGWGAAGALRVSALRCPHGSKPRGGGSPVTIFTILSLYLS